MQRFFTLALVVAAALLVTARSAKAIPNFQKAFFKLYLEEHEDEEFVAFMKRKAKCFICHQGKKDKHNHNAYGDHLVELLDHKKDKKDFEKITNALKEVEELPFDPEDEESQTYAERIAESKLPGADTLEELQEEPEGSEDEEDSE